MLGWRTSQAVGHHIVKRMQTLAHRRPHRDGVGRWSCLQDLQHADRNEGTILAIVAFLLVRTAWHVSHHVRPLRQLHQLGGQQMLGRHGRDQRRNRQARRHKEGKQEIERLSNIHSPTFSQAQHAGKVPGGHKFGSRRQRPSLPAILRQRTDSDFRNRHARHAQFARRANLTQRTSSVFQQPT
jgi:hypothetical protein